MTEGNANRAAFAAHCLVLLRLVADFQSARHTCVSSTDLYRTQRCHPTKTSSVYEGGTNVFDSRLVFLVKDKIGKLYEVEVDLSGKVVSGSKSRTSS